MADPETRTITLGGRTFAVPRLPLGVTMLVYPICQRLTNAGVLDRVALDDVLTPEEMGDLVEIAYQAAHADDETLDAKALLALPVTPGELVGAFMVMRVQCGGWRLVTREDGESPGEPQGATPPTSTSSGSSPSSSATSTVRRNTGSRTARSRTGRKSTGAN